MRRIIWGLLFVLAIGLVALGSAWVRFVHTPLELPTTPFEFTVEKGTSLKSLARQLQSAGLLTSDTPLWIYGRLTDQATGVQAGRYRLTEPITPEALLKKLNDGDVVRISITFVEGVSFREMRAQLEAAPELKVLLRGVRDAEVLSRIGATERHPEGLFFPDTYLYTAGMSDLDILKASYAAMQKRLAEAWAKRDEGLPYRSPYEALIMASIIEKETGRADERPLIASVFINRLRIPMRLQTDPTVIYGLGPTFDGNIRRRDLTNDTPYNTYTRDGLPPTPIAMPGLGSLNAAVNPAKSDKLYFVATKDGQGSHYFSRTLEEHNRAVAKYQLGR
jgi:UPF0755 protein